MFTYRESEGERERGEAHAPCASVLGLTILHHFMSIVLITVKSVQSGDLSTCMYDVRVAVSHADGDYASKEIKIAMSSVIKQPLHVTLHVRNYMTAKS